MCKSREGQELEKKLGELIDLSNLMFRSNSIKEKNQLRIRYEEKLKIYDELEKSVFLQKGILL